MFERAPVFVGPLPRMPANAPPQPVGHAQPPQDFFKDQDREGALGQGGTATLAIGEFPWPTSKIKKMVVSHLSLVHF